MHTGPTTGLVALELVARMNQIPVDMRAIRRTYALPEDADLAPAELLRILKHLGFHARLKALSIPNMVRHRYPLPAILLQKDGAYVVLLKLEGTRSTSPDQAMVLDPRLGKNARTLSVDELNTGYSGRVIVLSHKKSISNLRFGFAWFLKEMMHYRQVMVEVMLGSFFVQIFALIAPLFTQVILDKVISNRAVNTLFVLVVAFVVLTLFEFCINLTRNIIFIHTASKIDAKLGTKLFKQLFSLPFVYFESRRVGNIVSRIRELDQIREFITQRSVTILVDLVFSVVFVVMMLLYSPTLTGVVLGFIGVIALLYLLLTPLLRNRLEAKFQMGAQSSAYLVEAITGIQTVKSLAIEGSMQRRWETHLGNYVLSSFNLARIGTMGAGVAGLLQKGIGISVLYVGIGQVFNNQMSVGQLIAFQMFASQLTSPVLRLVNLWNDLQQALMGIDRLGDILNHPVEIQSEQAITLPDLKGGIRFENVSFRYHPDGPDVLHQLSFQLPPGATLGIVGRSGSGKSTVTKLVQRLYLAREGAIYIDGIDARHLNPMWLRQQIGTVIQDSFLFSGTIRENIAMAQPEAGIEEVIEAATMAGAHDFITQMPEGYDTFVGERGSALSGGQRQRIAIARALLPNPRILIFDEATAALDYESERIIMDNLEQIRRGRTMMIIAHRLTTVRGCDVIFVVDKGNLVEAGTHEQLMAQNGYYAHLHQQQSAQVKVSTGAAAPIA
jgi:subfamily B ATP-binding cassette protein HlyB/CyaB